MKFTFRTRDNISPIGLQNIYISHCPDDAAERDRLISTLLENELAPFFACWYDGDQTTYTDAALSWRIGQMDLMVLLVTNRMLNHPSRSLAFELEKAREHRIPILTVLTSGCDIGEFRHRFAQQPFIAQDDPAFAEQLDRQLCLKLGSAELHRTAAKGIFCGHIYICSAPEDREIIPRLAARLRSMELLYDFALIHDDLFGVYEPDADEQQALIQKSSIVLIVATSHLGQRENRLINQITESGKHVIAVTPEDDRHLRTASLNKLLTDCISISNQQLLMEKIGVVVGHLLSGRNTLEHQHRLAQSYLYGINTLASTNLALDFLKSAAQSGYLPSQILLVDILRGELGFKPKYDEAATAQMRIIEKHTQTFNASPTPENAIILAEAINLLGSIYLAADQQDKAENAYKNCITLCERRKRGAPPPELLRQYAIACEERGRLREAKFDIKTAEEHYRLALENFEKLQQSGTDLEVQHHIGQLYLALGNISMSRGRLEDADEFYRRCYEQRETTADLWNTVHFRRELAEVLERLGQLYERCGDTERSEECTRSEIEIFRSLSEENGSVQGRRDLARAISTMCRQLLAANRLSEAQEQVSETIALRERLLAETESDEVARELIADYDLLGDICAQRENITAACDARVKGVQVRKRIAEKAPDDNRAQEAVAEACLRIAMLNPESPLGREMVEAAVSVFDRLYSRTRQKQYRDRIAEARLILKPRRIVTEKVSLLSRRGR
ncbi:MAG: TIR domain-containing protein [Ruminococcaceae bacterium]|nr:TIR domain-containing protein [Oscillospiraceae bacterium]